MTETPWTDLFFATASTANKEVSTNEMTASVALTSYQNGKISLNDIAEHFRKSTNENVYLYPINLSDKSLAGYDAEGIQYISFEEAFEIAFKNKSSNGFSLLEDVERQYQNFAEKFPAFTTVDGFERLLEIKEQSYKGAHTENLKERFTMPFFLDLNSDELFANGECVKLNSETEYLLTRKSRQESRKIDGEKRKVGLS